MNNKLKELRKTLGLTQKEVATALEITTSYYGMLEQSDRKPNILLAYRIAIFFNSTIEYIFFENENNIKLCEDVS